MNYLMAALLTLVVVGTVLLGSTTQAGQTIQATENAQNISKADALFAQAVAATGQQLAAQAVANPNAALTAGYTWRSGSAVVTSTIAGDTTSNSHANVTAADVETGTGERRVAVDFAVQTDDGSTSHRVTPVLYHRVLYRLYTANGGGYQEVSDTVAGSTAGYTLTAAADYAGCNGSGGNGCDPNAVQAQQSDLMQNLQTCVPGVGSGTCSSSYFNTSNYTNAPWDNAQASTSNN